MCLKISLTFLFKVIVHSLCFKPSLKKQNKTKHNKNKGKSIKLTMQRESDQSTYIKI